MASFTGSPLNTFISYLGLDFLAALFTNLSASAVSSAVIVPALNFASSSE
jgi:hypothetical protein